MKYQHTFAIPAYKQSPFLEDCIASLKAQTVPSRILICTSTPSAFLEEIAARHSLPLLVNPSTPGIASDWRFAAGQVETPCYTLAHQDDLYYPQYTETLLPRMDRSMIAFTNYEELIADTGIKRRSTLMLNIKRALLWKYLFTQYLARPWAKRSILRLGSPICCPSVMYHKERLGDFQYDPSYAVSLDWDAWLRMADMEGAFSYTPRVLMGHRIHPQSETSRQIACQGRGTEDLRMFQRLWPKPIALLLARLYLRSLDSNKVAEDGQ